MPYILTMISPHTHRRLPAPDPDSEKCWRKDQEQTRTLELGQDARGSEDPEDRTRRMTLGASAPQQTPKSVQVQVNEGNMKGRKAFSAALERREMTPRHIHIHKRRKIKEENEKK